MKMWRIHKLIHWEGRELVNRRALVWGLPNGHQRTLWLCSISSLAHLIALDVDSYAVIIVGLALSIHIRSPKEFICFIGVSVWRVLWLCSSCLRFSVNGNVEAVSGFQSYEDLLCLVFGNSSMKLKVAFELLTRQMFPRVILVMQLLVILCFSPPFSGFFRFAPNISKILVLGKTTDKVYNSILTLEQCCFIMES